MNDQKPGIKNSNVMDEMDFLLIRTKRELNHFEADSLPSAKISTSIISGLSPVSSQSSKRRFLVLLSVISIFLSLIIYALLEMDQFFQLTMNTAVSTAIYLTISLLLILCLIIGGLTQLNWIFQLLQKESKDEEILISSAKNDHSYSKDNG